MPKNLREGIIMKEKWKKLGKKKKIAIVLVLILVFLVIGGRILYVQIQQKLREVSGEEVGVELHTLRQEDLSTSIQTTGRVESQKVIEVSSECTGKISKLYVSLGDRVEQGQVLCEFDGSEIEEQINQLRQEENAQKAEIENAKQAANRQLEQANREYALAQEYTRNAEVMYQNAQLQQLGAEEAYRDFLDAKASENSALQSVEQAQDAIAAANQASGNGNAKQIEALNKQLSQRKVVAEQSGIITELNISQGSVPTGTLMKIEDDQNLKVKVSIKEKDIKNISVGMGAEITAEACKDAVYTGSVTKVINFASATSNSYEGSSDSSSGYGAEITVNPNTELLLGMTVKVKIQMSEEQTKLAVPYDAIGENADGSFYVMKAIEQENGKYKAKSVIVEKGAENEYFTEVISKELKELDSIVLYPYSVMEEEEFEGTTAQAIE